VDLPVVTLSAKRNSLHPWIYRRMVKRPGGRLAPGALVEVRSRDGAFLGRGIYNGKSDIAVRLLTESPDERLDAAFIRDRLLRARTLREETLSLTERTNAYRLIHGEADGLSGLVVDKFGDAFVMRLYSAGYVHLADQLRDGIRELYPGARVVARSDDATAKREGFDNAKLRKRFAPLGRVTIEEDNLSMEVDVDAGHKTGFFLDQRDNRRAFARLVGGKSVCDCFCYTGGFAISAARAGAGDVTGVDLDEDALAVARANADRNGVKATFVQRDVFRHLREMQSREERVDALVLDPAKLAGVRAEITRAKRTYGDLNRLGMTVVADGGLLLTCSCSGLVSESEFLSILTRAASEAGVYLQIFKIAGAAGDHPYISSFPEGRYLKAVFARVLRSGFPASSVRPSPPSRH
jgi:23S rRNA (cytosine1962-C5)-methyltransferase